MQRKPEPTEEELRALEAEADATYNCVLCGTGEPTGDPKIHLPTSPHISPHLALGERDELILLCDSCDRGHHTFCLEPPLSDIPEGDWYCPDCAPTVAPPARWGGGRAVPL